jgi:hypothetical protein
MGYFYNPSTGELEDDGMGDDSDWSGYGNLDNSALGTDDSTIDWSGYANLTPAELQALAAATPANTNTGGLNLASLLSGLKGAVQTNGSYDLTKIAPLLAGVYGASKSNNQTQKAGYQGTIPKLVATRQAPAPGQQISGNVTYAPVAKAAGGLLESGGFVIPADVVSHLGNGSSEAGLRLLADRFGAAPIKGDGDGMSDSIKTTIDGHQPARVANEEARLTKDQVEAAGGAKKLYAMMDRIRHARTGSKEQGKQIDPNKFMPGGAVRGYATGGTTTVPAGTTGTESSLSNWAGDYVTGMLGKGQALSEMPYDQFQGPLTAGTSGLQTQAFGAAGNLQAPAALGQAATTAGGIAQAAQGLNYNPVGTDFGTAQAQQYMNPYLKSALDPQMEELQRQNTLANMNTNAKLTQAGAFGGSRQAVANAENQRNMLQQMNLTLGQGYSTAYDKAMAQFNADQARKVGESQFGANYGLQGLQAGLQAAQTQGALGTQQNQVDLANLQAQAGLGAAQRGIAAEDIAAQKAQFEEARLNPYKMVQFQQSLLSGLPLAAQTYNQAPTNDLLQFANSASTVAQLLKNLGQTPTTPTTP